MNRNIGISAGFLAVIVFFMRSLVPSAQVSSPAAPAAAANKQAATDKKAAPAVRTKGPPPPPNADYLEGPWLATRHFYGPTSEPALPGGFLTVGDFSAVDNVQDCSKEQTCQSLLAQFFGIGIEQRTDVSFLLATVPDPLHSRLSLFTDSSIQAIEGAASDAGWQFATQWMPWNDQVDPDEKDPAARRRQRADLARQEKQPGVMVFRSPEDGQVLIVFLAGETPTAGINSAQFQLALAYMDAINKPGEIRIQGPTFSGSFASLSSLLGADKERRYRVRSGTVTIEKAGKAFQQQFPDFHVSTANSRDQTKYFLDALDDMRIKRKYAAVLVENESGFGSAVRDVFREVPDIKVFVFPREISHLRNAYREAVQSSKSEKAPAPDLDFSLKDPATGEDSIPTYSAAQSPLSDNGVLSEITNAIRRDGIRIVQVSATNVLDLLFIAQVLKQRCPDTRLMVSSPDVLFTQAAQTGNLAGTLALSSYPLFHANSQWMGQTQRQSPQFFPDANSEGVYNATRLLLLDLPVIALSDYHWKSLQHPPTWVLMLDRQGFLPVNVLPHKPEQEPGETWFQKVPPAGTNNSALKLPPPSGLWNVVSTTLALAGVLVSIWIFTVTLRPTLQVDARLTLTGIDSESNWRLFFLFLFLVLLVSMLVVMWSPLRPPNHDFSLSLFLPATVAGMPLLCLALFLLWDGFYPEGRGLAMLVGLLPLATGLGLWLKSCSDRKDRSLFFALRALELRFASSPTWPILAALGALLAWSFVNLTRFYLVACQKPDVLTTGIETTLKARLHDSFASFNASLESPAGLWNKKQWIWFIMIFLLAGLLCWEGRIDVKLSSIEGGKYDFLAIGLQLLVMLILLGTCWQIIHLWRSFQSFLSCLGIMPLATSFIRTDRSASNRPIWVRRLNLQSIDIHARSIVVLHDMALLLGPNRVLDGWIRTYTNLLSDDLLQVDSQRNRERALEANRKIRKLQKEIASEMFEVARYQWQHKALSARMISTQLAGTAAAENDAPALPVDQSDDRFGDLSQTFLALHYSAFILYGIRQIQYLVVFLSIGFVLLMFSMSSYSFQSPLFIGRLLLALFAVITWVAWTCLAGMERDPIVSRIGGTDPGKLNSSFYLKLLSYGGLPVLGLLASQFPSIANFLLSSVEPALQALR